MAESLVQDPNISALAVPPMDSLYFTASESNPADLEFPLDDNCDFQLIFDDIDGIDFPFESEPFLISDTHGCSDNSAQESACSRMSADIDGYLNCSFQETSSQGSGSDSSNIILDQKVKVEETGKICPAKRKKDFEDTNTSKFRIDDTPVSEEDEKKKARLMRNRESAQLSRQRKKHYVEELEEKVRSMHSTITDLNGKVAFFMAENASLRQQLNGGSAAGMCPVPPMYPSMAYPWPPFAPYMVRPHASQVPLVPIPRLKSQQPVSASKAKKNESKKSVPKTKKVASISFLGLLFFMLLFGGLVPLVNVRYGGSGYNKNAGSNFVDDGFYSMHKGKILTVDGHSNKSDNVTEREFSDWAFDVSQHTINCKGSHVGGPGHNVGEKGRETSIPDSENFIPLGNRSEPLAAALYVPRNDKLVKIDGNLIIHSVIASEKAMASKEAHKKRNESESGLAIPRDLSQALVVPDSRGNGGQNNKYHGHAEKRKALPGSADALKDHFRSSAANGKMQQWFREGAAGPMLSSGMCSEVFQFDVSPASASGAIVPASFIGNVSGEHSQNNTAVKRGRNRRILHGLPVPLPGSNLNFTGQQAGINSNKENLQGNKTESSMVVSVLVDPREAGDGDIDGMIGPKSLSRIFVVVLLDRVKYVTYSCVLPRSGPSLVTS